jgi:hypothetical protein
MSSPTTVLYVRKDGATHQYPDRKFRTLLKELKAGRGQAEMTRLIENGYDEFLGADGQAYAVDGMTLELLGYKSESEQCQK